MKVGSPLPFKVQLIPSKASKRRAFHMQVVFCSGVAPEVRQRVMDLAKTFQPRTTWEPEGFVLTRDRAEKFQLLFKAGFRVSSTNSCHYYSPPGCDLRFHLSDAVKLARGPQKKSSGDTVVPFADSAREAIA